MTPYFQVNEVTFALHGAATGEAQRISVPDVMQVNSGTRVRTSPLNKTLQHHS